MEAVKNIESVLEQAFQFGTFGTKAEFKSFKPHDEIITCDADLSQDSTGVVTYTDKQGDQISTTLVIRTINEKHPYPFKHLAFLGEISIRRRIIPYLEKFAPLSSHFARFRCGTVSSTVENDEAIIILERLENVKRSQQFWDHRQLFVAIKFLAKLHSTSYQAKVSDPNVFLPQLRRLHEINFAQNASLEISKELATLFQGEGIVQQIKATLSNKPEPKSVICVGILSADKTSFEYDSEGNPVDIKIDELFAARYAPPAFDLMNIMYLCVEQETRKKYWDEAIQLYYNTLTENTVEVPKFSEIQQDFKSYSLFAYVTASMVLERYLESKMLKITLDEIEQDILSRNAEE